LSKTCLLGIKVPCSILAIVALLNNFLLLTPKRAAEMLEVQVNVILLFFYSVHDIDFSQMLRGFKIFYQ